MQSSSVGHHVPRIIIHGGAGAITPSNLPPSRRLAYKRALLAILQHGTTLLHAGTPALEVAASVITLFEDDPLFNCGRGAVFNREGEIELEASVMISSGYRKRGAAVSLLRHVKNPVLLAKGILEHGDRDLDEPAASGEPTAQGHVHLSGQAAEELAKGYGLEFRPKKYFRTRRRWEEHKRGLEEKVPPEELSGSWTGDSEEPGWDGHEYLPQGTVGCVVMDKEGVICAATSTGGLTNKLPGRIGDTPTFGAGFWAEEGLLSEPSRVSIAAYLPPMLRSIHGIIAPVTNCLPWMQGYQSLRANDEKTPDDQQTQALGLSGTGNGDSFLRVAACRTASALSLPPRIPAHLLPNLASSTVLSSGIPLQTAVSAVAGPGGILERSGGERFHVTGEGAGGIIGLERRGWHSSVVYDMNCSGMFRGYVDDEGQMWLGIFRGDDSRVEE